MTKRMLYFFLNSCYLFHRKKPDKKNRILFSCLSRESSCLTEDSLLRLLVQAIDQTNPNASLFLCCPNNRKAYFTSFLSKLCPNNRYTVQPPTSPAFYSFLGKADFIFYDTLLPDVFAPRKEQVLVYYVTDTTSLPTLSPNPSAALQRPFLMADFILGYSKEQISSLEQNLHLTGLLADRCFCSKQPNEVCDFKTLTKILTSSAISYKRPKRVLIFCSDLRRNGITTSLLNLMQLASFDSVQYCFTFREESFLNDPTPLSLLPNNAPLLPIYGALNCGSLFEKICHSLYLRFHLALPIAKKVTERIYGRAYERFFGRISFDAVIHFTGYSPEFLLLLQSAPAKRILFVHNNMKEEYQEKHNFHLGVFTSACRTYETVAAVSQAVKDSLKKIDPTLTNVTIVENAHDDARIRFLAEQPFVLNENSSMNISLQRLEELLSQKKKKFITICRYSAEKGQKKLIHSFLAVHQKHPNTILIIIGGYGDLYEELTNYCSSLDCREDIVLIRNVSNPFAILKQCDLFLLPSDREPLGLVLLEADSLKIPIAATDIPGSGDFLRRYGGYLVPNNENGLISAMEDFLAGKIKPLGIHFEEYNAKIISDFHHLFLS